MTPATVPAARLAALIGGLPPGRPAYRGLAEAVRHLVADGRLAVGSRLPSERELTAALGVSRTTVTRAYALLRDGGFLSSRRGSGWQVRLPGTAGRHPGLSGRVLSAAPTDDPTTIDLTCAALRAPAGMLEAYEAALATLPRELAGAGHHAVGLPVLRERIAARYADRGLPTDPDQVIVVSGAVAGVHLALAALTAPGDRVAVEDPGFPNTLTAVRLMGRRLAAVPVDPSGWDLDQLARSVRAQRPAAAVLVPDFQNPTGALMSAADRATLAEILTRAGTLPVIDETVCEIHLEEGPLPRPFAAHHPGAISVGSSSKTFWGGLRVGWVRAPRDLVDRVVEAALALDPGAAVLEQVTLAGLLEGGDLLGSERRQALRVARDSLAEALRQELPDARFRMPSGGLSLWVELAAPVASALADAASERGLYVAAGPRFAAEHGLHHWVRVPYVQSPERLTEAARRLGEAYRAVLATGVDGPAGTGRRPDRPIVA